MIDFLGDIGKGISGGVGNFIGNIGSSLGNAAGSAITNALFGRQDRISNKDFQFYQDLIDSTIPREINRNQKMMEAMTPWDIWRTNELNRGTLGADIERQNAFTSQTTDTDIAREKSFLANVAPAQADAYNVQQDMTYGEDTRRANERILQTSDTLGMSPWELMGAQSTGPVNVPLPGGEQRGAPGMSNASAAPQFLAQTAQSMMGNQTQLQTAAIQAQTSKEIARMNNETQLKISGQATDDGNLARGLVALQDAQKSLTEINQRQVANKMVIDVTDALMKTLPQVSFDLGMVKGNQTTGAGQIQQFLGKYNRLFGDGDPKTMSSAIEALPQEQFNELYRDLLSVGGLVAKGAGLLGSVSRFIPGVGGNGSRRTRRR